VGWSFHLLKGATMAAFLKFTDYENEKEFHINVDNIVSLSFEAKSNFVALLTRDQNMQLFKGVKTYADIRNATNALRGKGLM
jgi:hypothetical protein